MIRFDAHKDPRHLGYYLEGMAAAARMADTQDTAERLSCAGKFLIDLADHRCGQGYIGCNGGEKCGSDHK